MTALFVELNVPTRWPATKPDILGFYVQEEQKKEKGDSSGEGESVSRQSRDDKRRSNNILSQCTANPMLIIKVNF